MGETSGPRKSLPLEHAVLIGRVCWYLLSDVPNLCNPIALDSVEVHHGYARVPRLADYMEMDGHEIPFGEDVLDVQSLVGCTLRVLLHGSRDCLPNGTWGL